MHFIFHYPDTYGIEVDMLDPGPVHEVAAAAERFGFDAISFSEHPVPGARWIAAGGHQTLDPFVSLACAAGVTSRLRLLTHLAVAPYRNPFLLAKAAVSVDRLSGGRFILGIGSGYLKTEFDALGVEIAERNALFEESLDVLPLYWSGEPFSYKGLHFDARHVIGRPRPIQNPIPIWIGGNSKLARRRVAERAQGWMPMVNAEPAGIPTSTVSATARTPFIGSIDELAGMVSEIREAAAAAGRTDSIDVLCYHRFSDRSPAHEADRHREALANLEKAGITWVVVMSDTRSPAATFEFLEAFGSTYVRDSASR